MKNILISILVLFSINSCNSHKKNKQEMVVSKLKDSEKSINKTNDQFIIDKNWKLENGSDLIKYAPVNFKNEFYLNNYNVNNLHCLGLTFQDTGHLEFISAFEQDYDGRWDYKSVIKSSSLIIKRIANLECEDFEGNSRMAISHLEIDEHFKLTKDGMIHIVGNDTIVKNYCRQQKLNYHGR